MNNKMIKMIPKNSVYSNFKFRDYKIYKAICEFIDNSTQSFFDHNELKQLVINIDFANDFIRIRDNAFGMSTSELEKALELGDKPKFDSGRNQFGMGMKIAAIWFSDKWKITTKKMGEKFESAVTITMNDLLNGNEIPIFTKASPSDLHYTVIELLELDKRRITKKSAEKISQFLSVIYRNDLLSGKIKIFLNEDELIVDNYEFAKADDGSDYKTDIDFSFIFEDKEYSVKGFVGISKVGSTSDTKGGFSLLDNGRVIIPFWKDHKIVKSSNSYSYQRLFGELSLINFNVTNDKQNFDWDNGLFDEFKDELSRRTDSMSKLAEELRFNKTEPISNNEIEHVRKEYEKPVKLQYSEKEEIEQNAKKDDVIPSDFIGFYIGKKKININNKDYFVEMFMHEDESKPFFHHVSENTNFKIWFNRNHDVLRPKVNNKEELMNYTEILSALTIAMDQAKILGIKKDDEKFMREETLLYLFEKTLKSLAKK